MLTSMRKAFARPAPDRMPLTDVRQHLRAVLADCAGMQAQRLQFRVQAAQTATEMWMLRGDLYDCVARHHSQCEAARRINALLACFDGWLPRQQLVRI